MRRRRIQKAAVLLSLFLILICAVPVQATGDLPLKEKYSYGMGGAKEVEYENWLTLPYYSLIKAGYIEKGYLPVSDQNITLSADEAKIFAVSGEGNQETQIPIQNHLKTGIGDLEKPALYWDDSVRYAEWTFNVAVPGLYEIEIEYYMLAGSGNPAVRSLFVDDDALFLESSSINFPRFWRDEGEPVLNSLGDEVRPGQVEVNGWNTVRLTDSSGYYADPFSFYFNQGIHKVRLEYVDQDMAIAAVSLVSPDILPTYDEVEQIYFQQGYSTVNETVVFEAETTTQVKSDPTIRRESNGDPASSPYSSTSRKLNVIGGYRWRKGNQSITWAFTVPKDGLYELSLRYNQSWNEGLPSYRQIAIDGVVPFNELNEYKFPYNLHWQSAAIANEAGEPYLFYLTAGEHTLSMTVKMGSITPVIQSLNEDTILLSNMIREITMITGSEPDPNYDYKFFETIPSLKGNIEQLMASVQAKYDYLMRLSTGSPAMANNFLTIKEQLAKMVDDPFIIAAQIDDLENAQTSLSTWYLSLQSQPLLIDMFSFCPPDDAYQFAKSNLFQRIWATLQNFFLSFYKDYDNVGSVLADDTEVKTVINVWVARGTEWAELIKEMADEDFTPATGIMVNMNVIPAAQLNAGSVNALMLSITSGKAPDVGIGVDSNSPVEFAIRDAVLDLSELDGYTEIVEQFVDEIMVPYTYRGGVYALPETMDFTALFYRKDIISELGIILPDTWEELYSFVLPTLYQNGMEFYYPADFTPFLFQNNGFFYTEDGLHSALDTSEAFQAFREYTEMFTHYGVPVMANFFNRFRTGEMPIGIGNYNMYMQLSIAAPELAGKWGIALIPGVKKEDGSFDRSNGTLSGQCDIIMKQSDHCEEAWKFLKWWSSTDVQMRFAREIEAIVGAEARWNTANIEAFTNLSWNRTDLNVIMEQLQLAKGTPVVLGGYYTSRYINNAWNSVVVNGDNVRDTLEKAFKEINRELRMKQEEYGVYTDR